MAGKEVTALAVSREDVEQAVSMKDIVGTVEAANRAMGQGETVADYHHTLFDKVAPGRVPDPHANFQSFSAYLKAGFDVHGIASCGSCPHNPKRFGLPYLMGVIILNDRRNGVPLAVIEMSRLVEIVTSAVSAVGAKYLANVDAHTLGILGCGNQGRMHVDAVRAVRDIGKVVAYDINKDTLAGFADEVGRGTGLSVVPADAAEQVMRESDIVAILISSPTPTAKYEWIKSGALVVAASGFGQELYKEGCYRNADAIVVDDWGSYMDATFDDVGATDEDRRLDTILKANWEKCMAGCDPADLETPFLKGQYGLELPKIILGEQKARKHPTDKIIFLHAGMSANMVAAAHLIWTRCKEKGLGTEFRLL